MRPQKFRLRPIALGARKSGWQTRCVLRPSAHSPDPHKASSAQCGGWVKGELQRAILLDPDYYDPGSVEPDDHRFIQLYAEAAALPPANLTLIEPPPGGFVMVDGVRDAGRPDGVASIVQVFNADYMLVDTVYLPPGAASPSWAPKPVEPLVDESFQEDEPAPAPTSSSTPATAPAAAEPSGGSPVLWLILGVVGGVVLGLFLCCFLSFIV